MRRLLYWVIHFTIAAAVMALTMPWHPWGTAAAVGVVAFALDGAVAGLARSVGR